MDLYVIESEVAVKGDTATNVTKQVTLETGLKIQRHEQGYFSAQLKGLSLAQAQEQTNFSLASFPWFSTNHFVFSLSKKAETTLAFLKKTPPAFSFWDGTKQQSARLSYLGRDQDYSLWQAKTKVPMRLCLGANYLINSNSAQASFLMCSSFADFKNKRQSLASFLLASRNLSSFLNLRLKIASLRCPSFYQHYLPDQGIVCLGDDLFMQQESYERIKRKIIALAKKFGGIKEEELIKQCAEDSVLVKLFLKHLCQSAILDRQEGYYWYKEEVGERLSPLARCLLKKLEQRAWQGLSLANLTSEGEKETLKALKRVGLIAGCEEENFYFSWQALNSFHKALKAKQAGLESDISVIKKDLAISRKVAKCFCEALKNEGLIKRENNIWSWLDS
ncbi:UNVERIFIED_CONTAM: hypothetical protein PYX00_011019 [Menopon gallinae]|uniref:Elongation factor P C-terminal domain-containing protein n=1 Tax=Menopon gallinae TaxID=328185 RepID=A0AAW2H6T9_9NEOP